MRPEVSQSSLHAVTSSVAHHSLSQEFNLTGKTDASYTKSDLEEISGQDEDNAITNRLTNSSLAILV